MGEGFACTPFLLLNVIEFVYQYKKRYRFFYRARAPVCYSITHI
jgi:hypothetical protein